ncbi:MAG: flagellar biosynthesis protein FliQ [Hyphomonadaceae bacterium]|jgi:flagellar biosynthetic protein FliQ
MDGLEVLDLGRDALWTTVWMCAPVMIAGLVVGLVIAFFQALTQIQEMTLVFVPKIIAIFAALLIFLPLMGALLAGFAEQIFTRIADF